MKGLHLVVMILVFWLAMGSLLHCLGEVTEASELGGLTARQANRCPIALSRGSHCFTPERLLPAKRQPNAGSAQFLSSAQGAVSCPAGGVDKLYNPGTGPPSEEPPIIVATPFIQHTPPLLI